MRTWVLAGLVLVVTALNSIPFESESGRAYRFLPDMASSPAVGSFSRSPLLPGGTAQQLPPSGALPLGFERFSYAATPADAERAGRELHNPIQSSPETVAAGRKVFRTFCIPCHGAEGLGDGTVVGRGFPAPPSLVAEHARSLPDGQIYHILSLGQANMPSYQNQLTPAERWTVIHFLRELQSREGPR